MQPLVICGWDNVRTWQEISQRIYCHCASVLAGKSCSFFFLLTCMSLSTRFYLIWICSGTCTTRISTTRSLICYSQRAVMKSQWFLQSNFCTTFCLLTASQAESFPLWNSGKQQQLVCQHILLKVWVHVWRQLENWILKTRMNWNSCLLVLLHYLKAVCFTTTQGAVCLIRKTSCLIISYNINSLFNLELPSASPRRNALQLLNETLQLTSPSGPIALVPSPSPSTFWTHNKWEFV